MFSDFSRSDFIFFFCCLRARATKRMFVYFVAANFHLARATICALSVWTRALKPNSVLCNFRIEFNSHQLFRVSRFIPMFMIFFFSFGPIFWTAGAAALRYRVCVCASGFERCDSTFGIRGGHFCVCRTVSLLSSHVNCATSMEKSRTLQFSIKFLWNKKQFSLFSEFLAISSSLWQRPFD